MDAKNYVSCGETARLIFQMIPPPSLSLSLSEGISNIS